MMYETIFNLFNSGILLFWMLILFFPKKSFTQSVIAFPWVPLSIAIGYVYFLSTTYSHVALTVQDFFEIWNGPILSKYRRKLLQGDRSLNPCKQCNADGEVYGGEHYKAWKNLR